EQDGFHWEKCDVEILLHPQSADISQGVDAMQPGTNREEGAGDQGIMFGYACNETPDLMPAPIFYAHKILRLISEARHSGKEKVLGPDSKSQVTVQYDNGKPIGVREIVVSHQHLDEDMTSNQVRDRVEPYVREALPKGWINGKTIWHINPTGKFYIGGPDGDSGLTGRKIIVDTYGGAAAHSPERIRPRSTAPQPTPRVILPRTSSPPVLPIAARCSSPTRSAWRGRCRSISTPTALERSPRINSRRRWPRRWI